MADSNVHTSVDEDAVRDVLERIRSEILQGKFNLAIASCRALLTTLPGAKSSAIAFINTIRSAVEGMSSGAVTKAQAKADLLAGIEDLKDSVQAILDLVKNPPASSFEEALDQDLSRSPLRVYDDSMNQVQTRLTRDGVFTGYVPIIPISGPPLDPDKLNKAGIPAARFAGYCILKKQFVAGLSLDYIRAHSSLPGKNGVARRAKKEDSPEKIIQEFRETVLGRYRHLHLNEMAEPTSWWGGIWLWFAPSKEVALMHRCTISPVTVSSLKVSKWHFPFAK